MKFKVGDRVWLELEYPNMTGRFTGTILELEYKRFERVWAYGVRLDNFKHKLYNDKDLFPCLHHELNKLIEIEGFQI